jgi:type III secretion protein T
VPVQLDTALYKELISAVTLSTARTTGLFAITPFLSRGNLTGMVRAAVTLSITIPVIPLVFLSQPPDVANGGLVMLLILLVKEVFIGMLLGLPIAVLSWGLEAAGSMIDNQRGATMASSLNPATGTQTSPLGILLGQAYVTWLFAAGGFLAMLDALYRSHLLWPAWSFYPNFGPNLPEQMLGLLNAVMRAALVLAGPALIAMFLSEFGLALVGRFAPNLQVFFMAMPIKSAVGILLLLLSLGVIFGDMAVPVGTSLLDSVRAWLP